MMEINGLIEDIEKKEEELKERQAMSAVAIEQAMTQQERDEPPREAETVRVCVGREDRDGRPAETIVVGRRRQRSGEGRRLASHLALPLDGRVVAAAARRSRVLHQQVRDALLGRARLSRERQRPGFGDAPEHGGRRLPVEDHPVVNLDDHQLPIHREAKVAHRP